MSTNHNRIKVADLETNEPNRTLVTNENGELQFGDLKIDSYNGLDYILEGKVLDARQGKILKDLNGVKLDKGAFNGSAEDLANSIPNLNTTNLKFGGYPSNRNDGQLLNNKVLSTDENGFLKMYTIPVMPSPYISELISDSSLPGAIGNIRILGDFFTPKMCDRINNSDGIILGGIDTIHYATFKSSQEIVINVTNGNMEGSFPVTLNNGSSTTKEDLISIFWGTVYIPTSSDWSGINQPVTIQNDKISTKTGWSYGGATLNFVLDSTKNYSFYYKLVLSPLITADSIGAGTYNYSITFIDQVNGTTYKFGIWWFPGQITQLKQKQGEGVYPSFGNGTIDNQNIRFFKKDGLMYMYLSGHLIWTFASDEFQNPMKVYFNVGQFDYEKIKYIEHN